MVMDEPPVQFDNKIQEMEIHLLDSNHGPPEYQCTISGPAKSKVSSAWMKHQCAFNIAIVSLLLMTFFVTFVSLIIDLKSSNGNDPLHVTSSFAVLSGSRASPRGSVHETPKPTSDSHCSGLVYDVAAIAPRGTGGTNVTWEQALDGNDPATLISSSHISGEFFLIGVTRVFITFANSDKKHFNCEFHVTVNAEIPIDCYGAKVNHHNPKDGIFLIQPISWQPQRPFPVWCDQTTDGGGWTVFQRRRDGSVDFHRDWDDYKNGFGSFDYEFWLGNDKLHFLSSQREYELRITLSNLFQKRLYANYKMFSIADEKKQYTLSVGSFSGTIGFDALRYHNGKNFTTLDVDNDEHKTLNCATNPHRGGWWFRSCLNCDLNGAYNKSSGIDWMHLAGGRYNIIYTEMKIRPIYRPF